MPRLINQNGQREFRRVLRSDGTPSEGRLWTMLRAKQVENLQFRRQYGMGPYVLDFYCPELKLAIELDGGIHFNDEQRINDEQRTLFLQQHFGITILRFENIDVIRHPQAIIESIKRFNKLKEDRS